MYGNKRIVLEANGMVAFKGGGNSHRLGCWYLHSNGKYRVDLRSAAQFDQRVGRGELELKGFGDKATKAELRDFVMNYYHRTKAMLAAA
jgi:hypothetical protein